MTLKLKILIFIFGLGFACVVTGACLKALHSADELMTHCIGVNNGEILPYPEGCLKPISLKDGVFIFLNTNGIKEQYVIIRLRDGTFRYTKIGNV